MAVEAATSTVDRFTAATRDLLQRVADLERAAQRSSSPTGGVMQFAGATAPVGWLVCNGASLLRATYPALFAAIGTTWGAVDGTHFTLPDLRGRTPIGVGTGTGLTARSLGATTGAETHLLTAAESGQPGHNHAQTGHKHTFPGVFNVAAGADGTAVVLNANTPPSTSNVTAVNAAAPAAPAAQAHNNMQPSAAVNFIIKT